MITIPNLVALKPGQVALIRVDPETGVPVSDSGEWLPAGTEHYLVFETRDEATLYAESQLKISPLSEFLAYDSGGVHLRVFNNRNALVEAVKSKQRSGFNWCWFRRRKNGIK